MIYDCFSFFNELDLLEIRLNTLDKVVDKFVLVESPLTHTGNPKPLYYAENKERFAKFNDRIVHVVVDDFPSMPDDVPVREKAWTRENWQRNAIVRGLSKDIKDDDILLISDLDEIPSPEYVQKAASNPIGVTRLDLKAYCFFINMRNAAHPIWNNGTRVLTWRTFSDPKTYTGSGYTECCIAAVNQGPSATRVRFLKPDRILKPAGWHFSYLGGADAIIAKLRSIAHTEFNTSTIVDKASISKKLKSGADLFGNGEQCVPEPFNSLFPEHIQHNSNKFAHLILPTDFRISKWEYVVIRTKAVIRDAMIYIINRLTPKCLIPFRHFIYAKIKGYNV